jgi:predicted O-methyltransferase YrrM
MADNLYSTSNNSSVEGIREITCLLTESDEWLITLIHIRDGLLVANKN